jgi:hypothetical protein
MSKRDTIIMILRAQSNMPSIADRCSMVHMITGAYCTQCPLVSRVCSQISKRELKDIHNKMRFNENTKMFSYPQRVKKSVREILNDLRHGTE